MKSAEAFCDALKQGISPDAAHSSLPPYELPYLSKIPVEVYRLAGEFGWRFFPVPQPYCLNGMNANIRQATSDLEQLKRWGYLRPGWALATGGDSDVFVLEVDGDEGQSSLITLCGDDWDWLETLRSLSGQKRYIYFKWPKEMLELGDGKHVGAGLRILGDGDWLLVPPSREARGVRHVYLNPLLVIAQAPVWLIGLAFAAKNQVDFSQKRPPLSDSQGPWPRPFAAEIATPAG